MDPALTNFTLSDKEKRYLCRYPWTKVIDLHSSCGNLKHLPSPAWRRPGKVLNVQRSWACNPAPPKLEVTFVSWDTKWQPYQSVGLNFAVSPNWLKGSTRYRVLKTHTWKLETQNPIWSSMPSTKTSHFLIFSLPAWGKNYHWSLYDFWHIEILGHIRPFCVLAHRLVSEQENVVVTFMVGPNSLEKIRTEISRLILLSSDRAQVLQRIR